MGERAIMIIIVMIMMMMMMMTPRVRSLEKKDFARTRESSRALCYTGSINESPDQTDLFTAVCVSWTIM